MDILNFIIYFSIAISGTVFGSFFTLAVHRIPKHQDITHERSYCPKCNHKLQFLDLIPVFSYIFLGGKCRYCGNKIRPRYLILEICSGLSFVLMALCHKISIESSPWDFALFAIDILFLCALFIIAGIDKEYNKIPNSVLIYACGVLFLRLLLSDGLIANIMNNNTINSEIVSFIIYISKALFVPVILFFINYICCKLLKMDKLPFGAGDIKYLAILGLYFGLSFELIGIAFSCLLILPWYIINKDKALKEIPWGFFLSIAFTIILIFHPIINF